MNQSSLLNPSVPVIPSFQPVAPQAAAMSDMFILVLWICAGIMAVVIFLVVMGITKYRHKEGQPEPKPYYGNHKLEIIWTVIPALIVIWLCYITFHGITQYYPSDSQKADLTVVAHQWWWEAHYPSGVVVANEIHIPVGQKWLVRTQSADVIHDFGVAQLARKMDVVPGMNNSLWLEADKPGIYLGTCNEYCGSQHAWMRFFVIAQTPEDFAAWQKAQLTPASDKVAGSAEQGYKDFHSMTCANCHAINNVPNTFPQTAPDLTHLASRQSIGAGILTNTPDNLALWLKNPQAIKPACLMPNLTLSDQQVADLVNYLETLK